MSLRNVCTIPTCRQSTWANVQPFFALYVHDRFYVSAPPRMAKYCSRHIASIKVDQFNSKVGAVAVSEA